MFRVSGSIVINAEHLSDVFICNIPGIVNRDGSNRDKKILRNISKLVELFLSHNKHVVLIASDKSPVWDHSITHSILCHTQ